MQKMLTLLFSLPSGEMSVCTGSSPPTPSSLYLDKASTPMSNQQSMISLIHLIAISTTESMDPHSLRTVVNTLQCVLFTYLFFQDS
ncbi:hypothetical protein BGZ63DRAFT_390417 [Mariannaea sp. PMI_226]|nr:hypothetical protein BGZ63DRAFT_390417 [Mariannaea sp. PMI_226]